jgi:hypothetical protein
MADKEHVEKIIESKFKRQRAETATLRANCTSGFIFTFNAGAAGQSAFHHILAVSSLQDGNIVPADNLPFFHDCMAITPWDINDGPNLIGLPLKPVYESADRNPTAAAISLTPGMADLSGAMGGFGAVPDLPCHQNEHDDYNKEQTIDLTNNIWQPLDEARKECSVDKRSILDELKSGIAAWRQFLTNRGKEHGGAANCWRNRNEPGYDAFWYIPFSMNPGTPRKAIPPPKLPTKQIAAWLETLFNTIR